MIRSSTLMSCRFTCVTRHDMMYRQRPRASYYRQRPEIHVPSLKILITFRVVLVSYAQNKYSRVPVLTQIRRIADLTDTQTADRIYRPSPRSSQADGKMLNEVNYPVKNNFGAQRITERAYREVNSPCFMVSRDYTYDIGCQLFCIWQARPRLDPKPVHVGFVVGKVTSNSIFFDPIRTNLAYSPFSIMPLILHTCILFVYHRHCLM